MLNGMNEVSHEILVHDAIQFMQSITHIMGVDAGMEAWNNINTALPDYIKTEIFMALLDGRHANVIRIQRGSDGHYNAINIIKLIRTVSGMSLKEAKDIWDRSKFEEVQIRTLTGLNKNKIVSDFRNLNMFAI